MAALPNDRYLDALTAQSALFAEALAGADLQQRVPTCPDWTLHRLAEHVGQAHRWVTAIVTRRCTAPPDVSELTAVAAPGDPDGLGSWLRDGADALVAAMRVAGPQTPVWTLHLHSTDPGLGERGEWIVRRTLTGPVWEHGHAQGDVAVRGCVVDLLLVLMRRIPPSVATITVIGDAAVLDHWLEHTWF
ncbi:MAG: maleylpyruvate isomerase N-terminal domain-containing protein [Pseudonocardiaceae bacterium]